MSEPKRTGLLELLRASQGCQFVIPVYQRNYNWEPEDQVKQYLSDLENVLKGQYKNHFLGIIIYLEKSIDFSTREFSVIDGQQRLTTTFLMIYAIKKILESNGDIEKVKQLEGQFLTNPYAADNVKYKLKPLVSDDDTYRCIIEDRIDDIENQSSNVLRNYNYIVNKLDTWIASGYDANKILMAMDRLYVVCVPISEEDNAQKIFESINATGAKLTAADLIRNYLLMDLKSDIQEKYYANYWKKIEDNVSSDSKNLEMFFRMFIAVKKYDLVSKNSVYREFMMWVEKSGIKIKSLLDELLEYSKAYFFLMKSDVSKCSVKLRIALTDYRKYSSDIPLSLIMELCMLYRKGKINEDVLGETLSAINAYLLRRSICDINSQNISKLFPTILKKVIEKCNGDYNYLVQILNQEMVGNTAATSGSYMPTDKQMLEFLYNANVYKRPALRIILDRMELDNNPAPVDLSSLSIEHLMPQTPTEEWIEELDTDLETYMANLNRIGNLTLASKPDNSKMSNSAWEYKNEVLKKTAHLKMNEVLIPIKRWDLQQIEIRTKKMIDMICKLYPYPDVKPAETDISIIDEDTALASSISTIGEPLEMVKKGTAYKSKDGKRGYIISASKMYPQGDKEKYWFGYREKRFELLKGCKDLSLVMTCRNKTVVTVKLPLEFIKEYKDRWNVSVDDEGNIKHYHIVIFINKDKSVTMLLSHPNMLEIDISKYVC